MREIVTAFDELDQCGNACNMHITALVDRHTADEPRWDMFKIDHSAVRYAWVTVKLDGSEMHCAVSPEEWGKGGHHATWFPDGIRMSMNLCIDRDLLRFVQVDADGCELGKMLDNKLGSGHPTVHPDNRHLLTDTCRTRRVEVTLRRLREGGPMNPDPSDSQRKHAAWRRRRIIYNNDGGEVFALGANTPESFLAVRMKPVLNTQVDSVFYCTGAATMFSHRAKIGEIYGKYITNESGPVACRVRDNLKGLAELGTDPLELVVEFCHENGLEVFFAHRINDIHDSFMDWELSTWKREHPEYLMGKPEDGGKYLETDPRSRWSAFDFEIPEVRCYLLSIIDDVLARYDVDGIEIDYFRNSMFFRPNLEFQPATPAQVDILTGFQQGIRQIAHEHGNRRGRPILLAARVPITVRAGLHVGIDTERWLEEGFLDVMVTGLGCFPFTNPVRELAELGHSHDVPVYSAIAGSGRPEHQTIEHWRGAVANFFHAGADGAYLFNTFPRTSQHPHFTELGDREKLAAADKFFAIDQGPVGDGGVVQALEQSRALPVELGGPDESRKVTLPVGDDLAAAAKAGRLKRLTLNIQFQRRPAGDTVEVRLNGEILKTAVEDEEYSWVTYAVDRSQFRHGDNVLVFRVMAGIETTSPIVIVSVELRVHYESPESTP